jgi:uncharacterized protein (TIGR00266 family)
MQFEIEKRPSYSVLEIELAQGEQIGAEPGAMMTRSQHMATETNVGGDDGVGGMVKRAVSDERSLVENKFHAQRDGATVTLVPDHPGDITAVNVTETGPLRVQSGSALAWEPLVEKSTEMNESTNFFSSGELTVLGLSGQGWAFLSSFGSIYERDVTPDEPLVADEDHIVAWTEGLSLSREKDGSIKSTMLGGEGFVTTFSGNGHVWMQTRNPLAFGTAGGGAESDGGGDGSGVSDFI